MCWDKATCWDYDAGVPKYMNRDPPCQSQTIMESMNETFSLKHLQNRCKDHQFFTIIDDAVQERDLLLYLDITSPFSNWTSFSDPTIVINGYMSFDTNFEWRHFDGTRIDYVGTFINEYGSDSSYLKTMYSTFFFNSTGIELNSKYSFNDLISVIYLTVASSFY